MTGRSDSGETLVGQGTQSATILRDIISGPDSLNGGAIVGEDSGSTGRLNTADPSVIAKPEIRKDSEGR